MSRQHSAPILVDPIDGVSTPLQSLGFAPGEDAVSEAQIQSLILSASRVPSHRRDRSDVPRPRAHLHRIEYASRSHR